MSRRTYRHAIAVLLFVAIAAGSLAGCGKAAPATEAVPDEAAEPGAEGHLAAAGDQAFSPIEPKAVADQGDDDEGGDDDDENTDFWKGVRFDIHNFEEVTDYVATYYIDDKVELQRAWVAASNGALGVLEPSLELLPESFLAKRKADPDEEGRLDGDTEPFVCGGKPLAGVLVHRIPGSKYLKSKQKKRPDRRLTDEEIEALRAKARARYAAYRQAWRELPFDQAQFQCAMKLADAQLAKAAAAAAAKPAAPAAAPPAAAAAPEAAGHAPTAKAGRGGKVGKVGKVGGGKAADSKAADSKAADSKATVAEAADGKAGDVKAGDAKAAQAPVGLYEDEPLDDDERKRHITPDSNRAWLAASAAYLYALDPHSAVIARKQWDESTRKTQDSSFEGIGAVLTQRDKRTIVENPMEDLPAWKAGVRAGDEIIKVDTFDIHGWMLGKVVEKIRGKKNTKVVLTLLREGEPKPLEIGIVRAHIPIKNVTGKLVPEYDGVAHIKMSGFVPRSARDLRDEIEALAAQAPGGKLKGLILDLRRNSGGLLNRAIDVADMFLRNGRIVSVKSRRKAKGGNDEEIYSAHDDKSDYDFPVVVLVDDGAASASEIVASALQENGRALVVGLRTFGKASVQTLFEPALHLDYYIKLTVARYYAPSGHTIQVTGVHPDVIIPPKVDGKIPVGFREENLTNHLDPIDTPAPSPLAPMVKALDKCVAATGKAKKIAMREPKPQVQPDFQMISAADYLVCLARLQAGK